MRNLKRALSLALASVMLLGMMVVGSSASFADESKIVNKEAVAITSGLGLFAGTTDGKFDPQGTVTRAQMATIIVKMLYGSEVDANQFKGYSKFSDVADFEGGWAEGYINLCSNVGVVGGYGDGTFKPGQAVTTAEAVTMILNALKVDAGAGTWPMTVMAKADEIKLFGDLSPKPGTNVALTRDQLAVIALEGLYFSPEGATRYKVAGIDNVVFDKMSDALAATQSAGQYHPELITEVTSEDSLAREVFELNSDVGYITANQATGEKFTRVGSVEVALETGLDMIGHYVTVYYAEEYEDEEEPGTAYCIIDEAKYVTVDDEIDSKKDFQGFFGTKTITVADAGLYVDDVYAATAFEEDFADEFTYSNVTDAWDADEGTYVIYEGEIIGYIEPAAVIVSKVNKVTTTAGKESITVQGIGLISNTEDDDNVVEYEGIAKGDIVLVQNAKNTIYTLTKVEAVEGQVTKVTTNSDGDKVITVNGASYVEFGGTDLGTALAADTTAINFEATYAIYAFDGKFIGWDRIASEANLADVVYVLGEYSIDTTDDYGNVVTNWYAQAVDMTGKEVSILLGIDYVGAANDLGDITDENLAAGFYTFELDDTSKDTKKAGIMVETDVVAIDDITEDDTIAVDAIINKELDSKTTKVVTEGGALAFLSDTTKYILVEGGGKKALDIAVVTGTITKDIADAPAIVAIDADDNITLEVVMIVGEDVLGINAEDYIFVTAEQLTNSSATAAGYEYEVYFTNEAAKKTVTLEYALTVVDENEDGIHDFDGLYTYTYDEAEKTYDLDLVESYGAYIKADVTFGNLFKTNLVIGTDSYNAADAKIVDTRTEDELKDSVVPAIETLADLKDAKDADHEVIFWALLDEDDNVTAIFVTEVNEIVEE